MGIVIVVVTIITLVSFGVFKLSGNKAPIVEPQKKEVVISIATPSATPIPTPSPSPKSTPSSIPTPSPTPVPQPVSNTPPSSGYARQSVKTELGTFTVAIVSADLNSTKVIVDTASTSDCSNDCPALSLEEYISRNGAYAGINGSYFCPVAYESCAGKTNSFDTLLMNKDKVYFNSSNNVYSTVPAVIFGYGSTARFVTQSLEWGRDSGADSVLANYPLLTFNGQIHYQGSSDSKLNNKGGRSFVGASGSTVYIGVVFNATVAEATSIMQALGIQNSLNLDNGGSTALWFSGYKAGPGRNIPNALLFVQK